VSRLVALLLGLPFAQASAQAAPFDTLATRFWSWRTLEQPLSSDDIPRIDRPATWVPDWSPGALASRQRALADFGRQWRAVDTTGWTRTRQVDYRLLGSAIARADWELNVTRGWRRNPMFYVDQTLGSIFLLLLQPAPFDAARSDAIVRRIGRIPRTVAEGEANLTEARAPFARLTIAALADVRPRLMTMARELAPFFKGADVARLSRAVEDAATSLEAYRAWLQSRAATLPAETAVGREQYVGFLTRVALIPLSPEEMVAMARQDWARAVAFESYERARNRALPELALFSDQQAQMAREERDEAAIRRFLEEKNILTVPAWLKHYRNLPLPAYLAPLEDLGVTDDLTSESRLDENGISYIHPPTSTLGYFALSTAKDPRPIIVHEGVPGHYMQLALAWAHENPLRRRYYDSGANEGIGFYAEEMMLQAGLFDDSPRTREIIYNFMRLRALRVEVDVKLALGAFTIAQAAKYLEDKVPMDAKTALEEAAFFASGPGQAITYEIGKLQILRFLADTRIAQGDRFELRAFHDFVWKNGNVPIALQRWEYLGLDDDIARLATPP
jgi:hypothetical protein